MIVLGLIVFGFLGFVLVVSALVNATSNPGPRYNPIQYATGDDVNNACPLCIPSRHELTGYTPTYPTQEEQDTYAAQVASRHDSSTHAERGGRLVDTHWDPKWVSSPHTVYVEEPDRSPSPHSLPAPSYPQLPSGDGDYIEVDNGARVREWVGYNVEDSER